MASAQDLLETYQLAIDHDPQLKSRYLTQFSVAEIKSQNIAQMLPTVGIEAKSSKNYSNSRKLSFLGLGSQDYWDQTFTLSFLQPIFHWDHWVMLDQADNLIAESEAEYQSALQGLMVRVTEAYFDVLSAEDNLAFTKAELKAIERQLEQAKQRFDVGLIAMTAVYEAQAEYDRAVASQIDADNLLYDSQEALREIIGDSEINLNRLTQTIHLTHPVPNDIVKWNEMAKTNNLRIIAALNKAEASRKNISVQQAGHFPTLDIVANYFVEDNNNSSFGLRGDTQSVGLQLNIPLFQGGAVNSLERQAEYDFQVARQNLLAVQRQVQRQLRNAYRDVMSSLSRVQALKATVASAKSALDASEAGFEVGTRTMIDVLSEQRNLYRAKRDYARSRYDYLIHGIKLKWAASSLTEQDLKLINQYVK